jgi:hypothetical protein
MAAGQPVLLWVSGSRGRLPAGVCGAGVLTGPAVPDRPGDDQPGGGWSVALDLVVAAEDAWLRREHLRADPRLAGAEVFRQPQAANPSFVTVEELAALRDHDPDRALIPRRWEGAAGA